MENTNNIERALGRVEEAVTRVDEKVDVVAADIRAMRDDHGSRIGRLERWLLGAAASVAAFVLWLGSDILL